MKVTPTDRRTFIAVALSAGTSALGAGLPPASTKALHAAAQLSPAAHLSLADLYDPSTAATTLSGEAADRLALRRLVDAWAHCADRRLAEQQANLFTPDGVILNYEGDPETHEPHSTIRGRAAIQTALAVLKTFIATQHLTAQSDVLLQGDRALGETYCLVHQFRAQQGQRTCQTLGIRYHDQFLRQDHRWYFAERKVIIDWSDTRVSTP